MSHVKDVADAMKASSLDDFGLTTNTKHYASKTSGPLPRLESVFGECVVLDLYSRQSNTSLNFMDSSMPISAAWIDLIRTMEQDEQCLAMKKAKL